VFTESVHLRTWIESLGSGGEPIGSTQPFLSLVYSLKCFTILLFDLEIFRMFFLFNVENILRVKISMLKALTKYFWRKFPHLQ